MRVIFFDIETVPTPDMEVRKILYPKPERKGMDDAPGNYKKEESIKKWIEREYEKDLEKWSEVMDGPALATDVDGAIIHSLSYAEGEGEIITLFGDGTLEREAEIVESFSQVFYEGFEDPVLCGYNIIGFDIPILRRAMVRHEIVPMMPLMNNKYRTDDVLDLMLILYDHGGAPGTRFRKQEEIAKIFGIQDLYNDLKGMDGAEYVELALKKPLSDEEIEKMYKYGKNDVHLVREIYHKALRIYF